MEIEYDDYHYYVVDTETDSILASFDSLYKARMYVYGKEQLQ